MVEVSMVERVQRWAQKRHEDKLLRRFGGIQTCPWCRQCAQSGGDTWSFRPWERNPFHDVLTCSVCGGTSLWRFEMGMMYAGALNAPKPAFPDADYLAAYSASLLDSPTEKGDEA